MPKSRQKSSFICQQCGAPSARWQGRCGNCGEWNSLVETLIDTGRTRELGNGSPGVVPIPINRVESGAYQRLGVSASPEFERVLGGGIVPGSLVLIGGDPGIGKSTLLLQIAGSLAEPDGKVLYVSGEESAQQVKLRADRLGVKPDTLYMLAETNLDVIMGAIEEMRPRLAVVDSIQTVYLDELESAAGSIGQLRECSMRLMKLAKSQNIPIFLVGHVTKEGAIAGPRVLEHIVDAVLYLEGERFHAYRLLRAVKNRFGSTNEVGVFEMSGDGLADVSNPSAAFLAERPEASPGSTVLITMEGTRPLLVEAQALTTTTNFGLPRRSANGIDFNRLLLIVAVLTKRVGLPLGNQDVYVNIVGGLKIDEPAADLGVALAIASSVRDMPVPNDLAAIGEIGLSGELRRVGQLERRLGEAAKLGFKRCLLAGAGARSTNHNGIETILVSTLAEAIAVALPLQKR